MSPAEVAEMRRHLEFLRAHRPVLRLTFNAAEDLLVNGQREPSDRGVCRHLLAKLDRAAVESALAREPARSDAEARARLLAGAVRLTGDVGVLLMYLETLTQLRTRAEQAQAFAEAVRRIDFAALSTARLIRLLQVMLEIFEGPARVQALLGLLENEAFGRAWDAAAAQVPPELAAAVAPVCAVARAGHGETRAPAATLRAGLEVMLSLPDGELRTLAPALLVPLVETALEPGLARPALERVAGVLLPALPGQGRDFSRLALRAAARFLALHDDKRAEALLEAVVKQQPGFRLPARWLEALRGPRLARLGTASVPGGTRGLRPAFLLDRQREAWVRTAEASAAPRLAAEAALQALLRLPGVAWQVLHGVDGATAFVVVAGPGQPWSAGTAPVDPAARLALLAGCARILLCVAREGVGLPDAALERFLVVPGAVPAVTLADLDGATRMDPAAAATANRGALEALLKDPPGRGRAAWPESVRVAASGGAADLAGLVEVLDRAALEA